MPFLTNTDSAFGWYRTRNERSEFRRANPYTTAATQSGTCRSQSLPRHIGPVAYTSPSVASYDTLGRRFHYSDLGGMEPGETQA